MRPKKPAARPPRPVAKPRGLELSANPRQVAFRVLKDAADDRRSTPEESLASQGLLLNPRDLGLATALVYEVLRHKARLSGLARSRLSRGRAAPELLLVLEIGLAQLLFFDRLGQHAVVSETVSLAKAVVPGRQGLVNAILRGLLREKEAGGVWPPEPPTGPDPVRNLALRHSYPDWMVRLLMKRFGEAETEALLAAGNQATPPTLRLNPLKGSREELQKFLPFETRPTELSPWGLAALEFSGRPEDWPGFAEGRFAVQDEASQLVGLLAGPLSAGATGLDACAGLGSKALHLAALNPTVKILARDKESKRLELLSREAVRLGLENVRAEAGDLLADPLPAASFDLVIVDAPCSGLGVVRRRPDLKWNKSPDDPARLAELQLQLLTAAAWAVKPGGRLLYGVCTFTDEEGPGVVRKFLAGLSDFKVAPAELWPEILRPYMSPEGLMLLPHRHQTDGFFWAVFIRN
jgi:tRNA and rRNA cytosine-C5-methylases